MREPSKSGRLPPARGPTLHRPNTARVLAAAFGVGLTAEVLLDGHLHGLNVLLATSVVVVAGGVRRIDPLDAWIPPTAIVLAGFVALRDDAPLVLLDELGAVALLGA